jgi:hypothetical protein
MLRGLLGWALVVFAVYYLVTDPDGAAGFVHACLGGLQHAGNSLSKFANNL